MLISKQRSIFNIDQTQFNPNHKSLQKIKKNSKITRRGFIGTTSAVAAGLFIVPSNTIAGLGHKAPSDKLNIAGIGIGGMGKGNLDRMATENIVALCDVDWGVGRNNVPKVFETYTKAVKYYDWRKMFDEMGK